MLCPFKKGSCRLADGASEAPTAAKKGSKAKAAPQNGTDDAYDGECWAFSSRYIKITQAALQMALHAIEVSFTQAFCHQHIC